VGIVFWLTAVGYLLVVVAAWLLYVNAPRERPWGLLPTGKDGWKLTQQDDERIQKCRRRSRYGFLLLLVGTVCQGLGAIVGLLTTR
jgi:hypothetical protein